MLSWEMQVCVCGGGGAVGVIFDTSKQTNNNRYQEKKIWEQISGKDNLRQRHDFKIACV